MSDLPIIIATIISILVFQLYCGWDKIPEISNIECCEKNSFGIRDNESQLYIYL
jgi:hypothetical protein